MISDWDFPDAAPLLAAAAEMLPRLAGLRARCHAAGVPVIYANDNQGRWRSQFSEQMATACRAGGLAEAIARTLAPSADDVVLLKPRHSAFYATPLALLLEHLQVRRIVLAGVTTDQCVLQTAADAHMRGFDVQVPRDCCATHSAERQARALKHFEEVLGVGTVGVEELQLGSGGC